MKNIMLKIVLSLLKQYAGSDLFNRINELVLKMINENITSEEKKEIVVKTVRTEFVTAELYLINAIIEMVLLKINK